MVVEERGRWAVDIVVVFADGVVRKRINTHRTKPRAELSANLIKRAAERDIRDRSTGEGRDVLTADRPTPISVDPTVLAVRPQPLGAFPLPLGYMLIPASPGHRGGAVGAAGRSGAAVAGGVGRARLWRWPVTATARWRR